MKDEISRISRLCQAILEMTSIPGWEAIAQKDTALERDLHWSIRTYQRWGVKYQAAVSWGLWSSAQRKSLKRDSLSFDQLLSQLNFAEYTSEAWGLYRVVTVKGFGGKQLWGDGAPKYEPVPRHGRQSKEASTAKRGAKSRSDESRTESRGRPKNRAPAMKRRAGVEATPRSAKSAPSKPPAKGRAGPPLKTTKEKSAKKPTPRKKKRRGKPVEDSSSSSSSSSSSDEESSERSVASRR